MENEKVILNTLKSRFSHARYLAENVFLFPLMGEHDLIVLNREGYCYEVEVKSSFQDFKNDFRNKPAKHEILATGAYSGVMDGELRLFPVALRPNRYFFCCPEGMLKKEDVPKYAGLMWSAKNGNGTAWVVKPAPMLHRNKMTEWIEARLCMKFYFKCRNLQFANWQLQQENQRLNNEISTLRRSAVN